MLENALKNAKKRKKCEKMLDNVRKCFKKQWKMLENVKKC